MPSPKGLETVGRAAVGAADNAAERLLGETVTGATGRFANKVSERVSGNAGNSGNEALNRHLRSLLLGERPANEAAAGTVQRQVAKIVEANAKGTRVMTDRTKSATFDEWGEEIVRTGGRRGIDVVTKTKPATLAEEAAKKGGLNPAEAAKDAAAVGANKAEQIAAPAIKKPSEPLMPTKQFELPHERKIVTKQADGSVLTEYPGAPLPFRIQGTRGTGEIGAYGEYAATVKQLKDGSVTIGNPEGIDKIGRAFEKATNTFGQTQPILDFKSMPNWFKGQFEQLADKGVPAWFRGDSTWLYGQANASKIIKPVEAHFDRVGLQQLRYEVPTTMKFGPFEGLKGNAVGISKNGEAVLVNTEKLIGGRPETFIYKPNTGFLQSWREITEAGATQIKKVQLIPEALLGRAKGI
ncbi:MAG: hypothetical protein K2X77_07920 [Candidatus Obscuribacterales bacterium]|nr:hypothetical protein [Candidatus Obscuribacterales bacterium]